MSPEEWITSVGVDVGTTTTQVIVSRLRLSNPPATNAAASPEIRDREVTYRSPVAETPLDDPETIDVAGVAAIVEDALAAAGLTPADIDTGAVIVTGEAAKRENAERLVRRIAVDAGDFVATAAGASLEAVLAGRGSGAAERAAATGETVANVDVGGGTTNVAVFSGGRLVETRCLEVGARLVRLEGGVVAAIAPHATDLIAGSDTSVSVGDRATEERLRPVAVVAAELIADLLAGPPFDPRTQSRLIGTEPSDQVDLDTVVVTGGVGAILNDRSADGATPQGTGPIEDASDDEPGVCPTDDVTVVAPTDDDLFQYNDLGPLLARELRPAIAARFPETKLVALAEDLRATVVGVGTETTTFSGRTIWLDRALLPLRDVPFVVVDGVEDGTNESDVTEAANSTDGTGRETAVERALISARELYLAANSSSGGKHGPPAIGLYLDALGPLTYESVQRAAAWLAAAVEAVEHPPSTPLVIVTRENCANALGQALNGRVTVPYLVIDELEVTADDRIDIGEPLAGRDAVPVVIKTLAFGETVTSETSDPPR